MRQTLPATRALLLALLLGLLLGLFPLAAQAQTPNAWINEIHYTNSGSDAGEFVEIVVEDAGSVDLAKLDVELYRDDGTRYGTIGDVNIDFNEGSTSGSYTVYTWTTTLQNGPADGLALCFDDAPLQVLSYEGTFTGAEDCANGEASTDIGVSEDGTNPNTTSLQLEGSGGSYSDFTWTGPISNTEGNVNTGQTLSSSVTITVDDDGSADYSSIQDAIDAASAGDIIDVAAGTYVEDVTADKGVTLEGPNAGIPGDGSRGSEATIEGQVVISASGATFDGFDVSPPPANSNATGEALRISNTPDNVTVKNNIVRDFEDGGVGPWESVEAIVAFGGSASDAISGVTISDNKVMDISGRSTKGGAAGIKIQGNVSNATVTGNVVTNVGMQITTWAFGIVITDTGNHDKVPSNVTVTDNNDVSSILSDPSTLTVGVGFGFEGGDENTTTVANNSFSDTEWQVQDKTDPGLNLDDVLANNTFDRAVVVRTNPIDVPVIFSSIQTAVDSASSGQTVDVAAGTYEEQVVVTTGNLTISGVGAGADPASNTVLQGNSSGSGLTLDASDVTVEDLRLTGYQNGIKLASTMSNLTFTNVASVGNTSRGMMIGGGADLQNVTLDGVDFSDNTGDGTDGIRASTASKVDGLTITNSHFDNNGDPAGSSAGSGIEVYQNESTPGTFTNVTIENTTFNNNAAKGLYLEKLSSATIKNVTISNSGTDPDYAFNNGIDLNLKYDDYSDITIKNSTFDNSGVHTTDFSGMDFASALAIKARGQGDDTSYEDTPATLSNVTVEGNTFSFDSPGAAATSVRVGEPGAGAGPEDVTLRSNKLSDGSAIEVDNVTVEGPVIDGSGNWWGTTDESSISSVTSGSVDVTPFLDSGTDTDGGTPGFQGDFSTLNVTTVESQVGSTGRIQEGVDLVNGSTVNVGSGTYAERVTVDKEVTLSGPNAGVDAVDGSRSAEAVIDPGGGGLTDIGIDVQGGLGEVTIDGFKLQNYGGGGIIMGSSDSGTTLHVLNNIVKASDQIGKATIQVAGDNSTVLGNDVEAGSLGDFPDFEGAGILVAANNRGADLEGVEVRDNAVHGGDAGIGVVGFRNGEGQIDAVKNTVIKNNEIEDNKVGVNLEKRSDDTKVKENFVSDNEKGVLVEVQDGLSPAGTEVIANCITGNDVGAKTIDGETVTAETVTATGNWWGATDGPSGDFPGSGDPAIGNITENHSTQKVGACPSTAQCDLPTLAEDEVDKEEGTLSNTISDDDGVDEFTFTTLDGFKVISDFDDGFVKNNKGLDEDGVSWTWEGSGDPPTEVPFKLGATKSTVSYFLKVIDACEDPGPQDMTFDPRYEFRSAVREARLAGTAPNPFSGRTTVEFALPEQARVTVTVYDVMGRKVATLVDEVRSGGTHTVTWNGQSDGGQELASGVYFMHMRTDGQSQTRRVTIVR